jgi:hypothetical protein
MLFLITVINEIKWYVNCLSPSFPSHSKHSGHTVNIHPPFYQASHSVNQTEAWTSFLSHSSLFLMLNFQTRAQILFHIRVNPILLKSAALFSFDIQTFFVICTRLVILTLNNLRVDILVKKCESASDKLHPALYSFTVGGTSHFKWISGFILCTLYSSDHCAFISF